MSWVHPRIRPKTDDAMNVEWMEALRNHQAELSGNLGEHNWKAAAWSSSSQIAADAMLTYHHQQEALDHGFQQGGGGAGPTAARSLTTYQQWVEVPLNGASTARLQFTTDRAVLWITASFVWRLHDGAIYVNNPMPCEFALAVDGVVQIVGGEHGDPARRVKTWCPIVEAIVPVDAGSHVVALMARMKRNSNTTNDVRGQMFSYDMIVRERTS